GVAACDRAPASERLMNRRMRTRMSGGVGGRRGQPRLLPDWSCGAKTNHPVAARHPSSTRRGKLLILPSCEGGRHAAVSRTGGLAGLKPTTRRCAPPLLDEEGGAFLPALLNENGRTRQCRVAWIRRGFDATIASWAPAPSGSQRI